MQNPCYARKTHTDCPKRHCGCAVDCEEWKKYTEARDKQYLVKQTKRHDTSEIFTEARIRRMRERIRLKKR